MFNVQSSEITIWYIKYRIIIKRQYNEDLTMLQLLEEIIYIWRDHSARFTELLKFETRIKMINWYLYRIIAFSQRISLDIVVLLATPLHAYIVSQNCIYNICPHHCMSLLYVYIVCLYICLLLYIRIASLL